MPRTSADEEHHRHPRTRSAPAATCTAQPSSVPDPGPQQSRRASTHSSTAAPGHDRPGCRPDTSDRSLATSAGEADDEDLADQHHRRERAAQRAGCAAAGRPASAHRSPSRVRTSAAIVTEPVASTPAPQVAVALREVDRQAEALGQVAGRRARGPRRRPRRPPRPGRPGPPTAGTTSGSPRPRRAPARGRPGCPRGPSRCSTATRPTSRVKRERLVHRARPPTWAPAGLCAASTHTVGLRRTTSSRPGESIVGDRGADDVASSRSLATDRRTPRPRRWR